MKKLIVTTKKKLKFRLPYILQKNLSTRVNSISGIDHPLNQSIRRPTDLVRLFWGRLKKKGTINGNFDIKTGGNQYAQDDIKSQIANSILILSILYRR